MEEAEDTDTAAGAETNHVAAGPSGSGKGPPEKKDGQNGKVIDERSMNDLIDDLKKSQVSPGPLRTVFFASGPGIFFVALIKSFCNGITK